MIQITVTQNEVTNVTTFDNDAKAQKFLEQLQKRHIKQYLLGDIESAKKKVYAMGDAHKRGKAINELDRKLRYMKSVPNSLKVQIVHV